MNPILKVTVRYAAQEVVDETAARMDLADLPWIPEELKEVVRMSLGVRVAGT